MPQSYHEESISSSTDATIHNVRVDKHFTTTFNKTAQDNSLSFSARGLLWYLLSLPDNWTLYRKQLYKVYTGEVRGNGKDAVDRMMSELLDHGYLKYSKTKNEKGHWNHRYDVYPIPFEQFQIMFPQPVKPGVDEPGEGKPVPANPPSNTEKPNTDKQLEKETNKEHICPTGSDALFSNEKDVLGHPVYHEKYNLYGKGKEAYERLTPEQKDTAKLLRNVPPMNEQDKRFELIPALNVAYNVPRLVVIKAIRIFQEHKARGNEIKSAAAYVRKFIDNPIEPLGENGCVNREMWESFKVKFPPGMCKEFHTGIEIDLGGHDVIDLGFRMSPETFKFQLEKSLEKYKELRNANR